LRGRLTASPAGALTLSRRNGATSSGVASNVTARRESGSKHLIKVIAGSFPTIFQNFRLVRRRVSKTYEMRFRASPAPRINHHGTRPSEYKRARRETRAKFVATLTRREVCL
jgi:hypothetical protein